MNDEFIPVRYIIAYKDLDNNWGGCVFAHYNDELPDGFLWCDGSPITKEQYPELFKILQEGYGTKTFKKDVKLFGVFKRTVEIDNPFYDEVVRLPNLDEKIN